MTKQEFGKFRSYLKKTQRQMAQLLGVSLKAIQSFEQGWRRVPPHIERQILFLISMKYTPAGRKKNCWTVRKCHPKVRSDCPAYEFQCGPLCWFINGTVCCGTSQMNWREKMEICKTCDVFQTVMPDLDDIENKRAHFSVSL